MPATNPALSSSAPGSDAVTSVSPPTPATSLHSSGAAVTRARRSTSAKLVGLELPEAFCLGTLAAAVLEKGSGRDRRRVQAKALKLAESGRL